MDWIKKNLWQTILVALITVSLSTVGSLYVYRVTTQNQKYENAASTEYVDSNINDLKGYVNVQDNAIIKRLDRIQSVQQTKADKDYVDKLYQKTEENNRLLIEILLQIKELK